MSEYNCFNPETRPLEDTIKEIKSLDIRLYEVCDGNYVQEKFELFGEICSYLIPISDNKGTFLRIVIDDNIRCRFMKIDEIKEKFAILRGARLKDYSKFIEGKMPDSDISFYPSLSLDEGEIKPVNSHKISSLSFVMRDGEIITDYVKKGDCYVEIDYSSDDTLDANVWQIGDYLYIYEVCAGRALKSAPDLKDSAIKAGQKLCLEKFGWLKKYETKTFSGLELLSYEDLSYPSTENIGYTIYSTNKCCIISSTTFKDVRSEDGSILSSNSSICPDRGLMLIEPSDKTKAPETIRYRLVLGRNKEKGTFEAKEIPESDLPKDYIEKVKKKIIEIASV